MVPPNHPFVHRVFHEINHPFWDIRIFGGPPKCHNSTGGLDLDQHDSSCNPAATPMSGKAPIRWTPTSGHLANKQKRPGKVRLEICLGHVYMFIYIYIYISHIYIYIYISMIVYVYNAGLRVSLKKKNHMQSMLSNI